MGRAFIFGDNIDTDLIVPGRYLNLSTPGELAEVCMEGYEAGFVKKITPNAVFIAGRNFGCGSSREHAPLSLKAAGVTCVIAKTFARIFYRNSINIGLPVLESPEAAEDIESGNEITVDFMKGEIKNLTKGKTYAFAPFPPSIMEIINAGGLVEHLKSRKNRLKEE